MMILQWLFILLIRVPLILIGLFIVPIGICFNRVDYSSARRFTKYNTDRRWVLVTLPDWLWIWSNDEDGALGDKRGWWDANCKSGYSRDFLSKYVWLALRNPVNNMRFVKGISCRVSDCVVTKLYGQDVVDDKVGKEGFQLLKATGEKYNYYALYYVSKADENYKSTVIRLGHKIKLAHNTDAWTKEFDRWKGFTFRISFNKDIS